MQIISIVPGQKVCIRTPAKLNLFLDVLSKRVDGYHEVSTVMCPITLWDELEVMAAEDDQVHLELHLPRTSVANDPAWQIPSDASNLVCRAVCETQIATGKTRGCTIRLNKQIPAAAGLGGGSSDAAAAIVAYMLLTGDWDRSRANDICRQLGSDLNFFLGTPERFGWMHATGRGEQTHLLPNTEGLAFWMTHPPLGCATGQVYQRVTQMGSPNRTENFLAACQTGQESKIGAAMFNALQLPATEINHWIDDQLQLLADCGCKHTLMSGSGSSCFGFAPPKGSIESLRTRANQIGIERVYEVGAWFGPSIERQIAPNTNPNAS